jgi:hypothetical protein
MAMSIVWNTYRSIHLARVSGHTSRTNRRVSRNNVSGKRSL